MDNLVSFGEAVYKSITPSPSTFFVKTLHLTSVSFFTLDICSIVGKFKFLESLNLTKCDGIRYLTIDEYHYLRCLTVLDCPDLYFIWIIHVVLQSIRFRGRVCQICSVGDWVFADDAMLHFREGRGDGGVGSLEFYYPNLSVIANVRILTLCKWTFEAVIGPALFSGRKDFRFNELKELLWINSSIEENKFDALFFFLKFCPSLERLFIKVQYSVLNYVI
ncbi:hypothetical protein L1049_011582 [Liquidambar formosana]|uniref:At1g61320/AtMIF1 LRR domain-containing protein n=1 Tax=Liquidambar formosana TaxID=63359 RepID=A0AAP0RRQ8_LIQFO